ncbi:RNA 2',3'-cyclic phosphodiesterase [Candidatus Sumerlaeota bacterium]|nr:RNA 2',3'-cyclic phosphodiesterase [Candidatus Sumerlaeota bacterium]
MPANDAMRAFIALPLSPAALQRAQELSANLQKGARFTGAHPKWVEPENLHITLFFLGQIPAQQASAIKAALQQMAAPMSSFVFRLKRLGVFPHERQPRVLWLGVGKGEEPLKALQKSVVQAIRPLGFNPEGKPFHPHVTLARMQSIKAVRPLMDLVRSHHLADCGESVADRVVLFRSELLPGGPNYTELASVALRQV